MTDFHSKANLRLQAYTYDSLKARTAPFTLYSNARFVRSQCERGHMLTPLSLTSSNAGNNE